MSMNPVSRRKFLLLAAITGVVASACNENKEAETEAEATPILDQVKVEGKFGEEPKVTFKAPLGQLTDESKVLSKGDGKKLANGEVAVLKSAFYSTENGQELFSNFKQGGQQYVWVNEKGVGDKAFKFLTSTPLKSRIVMLGSRGILQVADVVEQVPAHATKYDVPLPAHMPKFKVNAEHVPELDGKPNGVLPKETKIWISQKDAASGAKKGDNLVVQYRGWTWEGEEFDSSFSRGSLFDFPLGEGQVIAGWDKGLVGAAVGSQVMLVIPPKEAYGEDTSQKLGGKTLIFVIDVIAIVPPSKEKA